MKIKIKRKNKQRKQGAARAQARQEARRDVRRVIRPATIPYTFWKQWFKARQRGEVALLFAMSHEEGPFRSPFENLEAFEEHARLHTLPSGPEWRLEKIKLDEQDAYLLSTRGVDDPGVRVADIELMHLRRTRDGWRLYEVKTERQRKERGNTIQVSFDAFGIESADHAFHQRLAEGFERPDLADHPDEEEGDAGEADDAADDAATGEDADGAAAEEDAAAGEDADDAADDD